MARSMKKANSRGSKTTKYLEPHNSSPNGMRLWYEQNKDKIERYAEAKNAAKLLTDVNQRAARTVSHITKENLRTYLQNISSNEANLRGLSRYLFYRSHTYFRLIKFFANQFDLNARNVIPSYNVTEELDAESMMQQYQETLETLELMNLQAELIKMYVIALREDVAFGCVYYNEDEGLFILPLDPDYCRIDGHYYTGDLSFKFDMTYWRSRQDELEIIGDPWVSMWNSYQSDTRNNRWQNLPDEYAFALKFRTEDLNLNVPPFSGTFNSLLSLINLEDIQSIADEQQIYKLIYMPMETLAGAEESDDWCISPDIMIQYFNRLVEGAVPDDYVSAAIVPGKELKTIEFNHDAADDSNRISVAEQTLLDTAGGGAILHESNITSTAAFNAALKANTEFAISTLLPQTQAWVNRFLKLHLSNPARVKFFEISIFTRDDFRDSMLAAAQSGLPVKLALGTLLGFSELDTLAMNAFEEDVLNLSERFKPLSTSYTRSNSDTNPVTGGRPHSNDGDLTESGERGRNS